uniref:Secreted protein n=1 Tax=Moniliophthora roreri TaxID=221103 RepID=A0A0W0FLX3_MONRR
MRPLQSEVAPVWLFILGFVGAAEDASTKNTEGQVYGGATKTTHPVSNPEDQFSQARLPRTVCHRAHRS